MPRGVPKEFEESSYFDHLLGKRFRKKRGRVVYEVIGGWADNSYERHYHFVNYFIRLRDVRNGRTTSVYESTFFYGYVEVK